MEGMIKKKKCPSCKRYLLVTVKRIIHDDQEDMDGTNSDIIVKKYKRKNGK